MRRNNATNALGLLIVLGFIWGSGFTIARYATTHSVHPLGYAFWHSVGPAVVLAGALFLLKLKIHFSWVHWRYYIVCGLLGLAIPNVNVFFAAPHLPAGLLATIANAVPVITYILAYTLGHEQFSWVRVLGILLAMVGISLILVPKTDQVQQQAMSWAVLAFLTPLCYASCALFAAKYRPQDSHPIALSAGMLLISSLVITPIVLMSGHFYVPNLPFASQDWVLLLEIFISGLGYVVFFQLIKVAGAVYYSLVGGITCLTGVFWGWLVLQETLSMPILLAIGLILSGIALVTLKLPSLVMRDSRVA